MELSPKRSHLWRTADNSACMRNSVARTLRLIERTPKQARRVYPSIGSGESTGGDEGAEPIFRLD